MLVNAKLTRLPPHFASSLQPSLRRARRHDAVITTATGSADPSCRGRAALPPQRPDRSAVKAVRDREQSEVAARIATGYLNLPLDSEYLRRFPGSLREAAAATLPPPGSQGFSEDSPIEPDW